MARSDCFVSIVAPICNDADILDDFISDVSGILDSNYQNYEIVLVDDGSTDSTPALVSSLLDRFNCIRYLSLSRKFGDEIAITAGLDTVIGDYVIVMLPNSDPPDAIPHMVEQARVSNGIVLGIRKSRGKESFLMKLGASVFFNYTSNVLQLDIPKNATHFRVMTRQAVNAVTQIKDRLRYMRVFTAYVGYSCEKFNYEPLNRRGSSRKRSFFEAVNLGINIIVSNTTQPLRLVSWIGLGVGAINLFYMLYVLMAFLLSDQVVEGWVTRSLQTSAMFLFVFLILAVLSEYIGRILNETQDRPLYYIKEERNSNVLIADEERRNVYTESSS